MSASTRTHRHTDISLRFVFQACSGFPQTETVSKSIQFKFVATISETNSKRFSFSCPGKDELLQRRNKKEKQRKFY